MYAPIPIAAFQAPTVAAFKIHEDKSSALCEQEELWADLNTFWSAKAEERESQEKMWQELRQRWQETPSDEDLDDEAEEELDQDATWAALQTFWHKAESERQQNAEWSAEQNEEQNADQKAEHTHTGHVFGAPRPLKSLNNRLFSCSFCTSTGGSSLFNLFASIKASSSC